LETKHGKYGSITSWKGTYTLMANHPDQIDELVNTFIKSWCGSNVSHLIDTDDNDGQRLRETIKRLLLEGRIAELKQAAAHNNSEYTSDYLEERIKALEGEIKEIQGK
jgi:hypothetical protein